ncbi:hypothetical protein NM208_g9167 [Fusarium decemcellulare]|uniref:Uncharacterized protein n=1 Tax=Fusarium decemcellulare TaxID=57161 RepID=A0ACC1S2W5_9HYPO|nr:hypothetical protein NM208_g9167 [Fusarium decemcellulare]
MPSMDERELASRVKALTKCVAANEPPENAIKLLESLKKDASPTEEMLRIDNFAASFGAFRRKCVITPGGRMDAPAGASCRADCRTHGFHRILATLLFTFQAVD